MKCEGLLLTLVVLFFITSISFFIPRCIQPTYSTLLGSRMSHLSMLSIASGSSGNCTYVGDEKSGVIIDCGPSTKKILSRLSDALPEASIEAVFISHEHTDHIASAAILHRNLLKKYGRSVPFYMSEGTYYGALEDRCRCLPDNITFIRDAEVVKVGQLEVEAMWIPHDVVEPLAFRVTLGDYRAAVVTDLGHCPSSVINKLRSVNLLAFEFNYDSEMLTNSTLYPLFTKDRIRGPYGHLSNSDAAEALSKVASPLLEHVVLSHVSENTNTPELAMSAALSALSKHSWGQDIQVHVGKHRQALPILQVTNVDEYRGVALAAQ